MCGKWECGREHTAGLAGGFFAHFGLGGAGLVGMRSVGLYSKRDIWKGLCVA